MVWIITTAGTIKHAMGNLMTPSGLKHASELQPGDIICECPDGYMQVEIVTIEEEEEE